MKIYVIIYSEDSGACGDDECCGGTVEYPRVMKKAFRTEGEAKAYLQTIISDYTYEIKEVEL